MKNEIILEESPAQIADIEQETLSFVCPCCGKYLRFRIQVKVRSVGESMAPVEAAQKHGLMVSQHALARHVLLTKGTEFLEVAKTLGVFQAFNNAVEVAKDSVPVDRDFYFLKWFDRAIKQNAPQYALRQCLPHANGQRRSDLELWGWQNVSAILANKEFKMFLPRKLVYGEIIETLQLTPDGIKAAESMDWKYWVRTKYGYVEKSSEFAQEMRRHSIGSFQL